MIVGEIYKFQQEIVHNKNSLGISKKRSENVHDTMFLCPWEFIYHLPGGKIYKFQQEIYKKQIA